MKTLKMYVRLLEDVQTMENLNGQGLYSHEYYNDCIDNMNSELDLLGDTSILKMFIETGTFSLDEIYTEGNKNDDLLSILEEYLEENNQAIIKYNISVLEDNYTDEEITELYTPINGGEYYIDRLSHVEEMTFLDYWYNVIKKEYDDIIENFEYLSNYEGYTKDMTIFEYVNDFLLNKEA